MGYLKGFFNNKSNQHNYIDVGSSNGFRAIAAVIIDNSQVITKNNLKVLLERFYEIFPEDKPQQSYLNIAEKLDFLINSHNVSALLYKLGTSLRQLAIDEMVEHPAVYKSVFIKGAAAILRKPKTDSEGQAFVLFQTN